MISATRRWFRRNRTPIAIGVGVVGAGYLATQYVLNKINDARERMSSDRIAKENLRRRFEQNQEDCTFTVLALLPTATANVLDAMNTENITLEIQQMKGSAKSAAQSRSNPATAANAAESSSTLAAVPAPAPSIADTAMTEEEGKSTASFQSEGGVHVSQMAVPSPSAAGGEGMTQDGGSQTPQTPQPPQTPPKPKKTKRQLWDELTISSITRVFTLIYTLALLTLLTRIQLNLLGRRSYLSSVVSLATGAAQSTINLENNDDDANDPEQAAAYYGSDFETNRKYLTFSWWLLNRGWVDVMERVEQAVRDVFGRLSPRDLLSFDTFSQLTLEVRKKVESGGPAMASSPSAAGGSGRASSSSPWLSFLLPPSTLEDFVLRESGVLGDSAAAATGTLPGDPSASGGGGSVSGSTTVVSSSSTAPQSPTPVSLRRLLDETSDLIESPTFGHVLTQLLDAGFSHLLNHKVLPDAFEAAASGAASGTGAAPSVSPSVSISITAPSSVISMSEANTGTGTQDKNVVMLPKILSVLTRQAHVVGSGGGVTNSNDYLNEMELVPDLEAFAAVVYSSNWENEIQRQERREGGHGYGMIEESFVSVAGEGSTVVGGGDESMVLVDYSASQPQQEQPSQPTEQAPSSFESAWEKATGRR
ncbi:peroxin [Diatrype stigma]|uniref:Peroxin n=1 Tax=Diatrype stigma TaxID=117547 RepID=A0AAN9YQN3_9PEZI